MPDLTPWVSAVAACEPLVEHGRLERASANLLESRGPRVGVGTTCVVERSVGPLLADVVGFRGGRLLLSPLGTVHGVEPDAVVRTAPELEAPPAAALLGRVVDGLGRPIDGRPGPPVRHGAPRGSPDPAGVAARTEVREGFETGIRALDAMLTCGRGQRLGIFAGAGVGKSSLLSMLLRHARADAVVLGLVGERGREVCRFVEQELPDSVKPRTIVVATTSGEPAQLRVRAALLSADLADELRKDGRHVLLVVDSLTRLAMAQREVGLAAGEAPTAKGYPPSVFSLLPRIVEKAGAYRDGSVTAFYAVLVEGDDLADPIADGLRGLLDGHVVLSRELAERGTFPAVDVLRSLSRLMPDLAPPDHVAAARLVRRLLGVERDARDLVRVGAYRRGTDAEVDAALDLAPRFEAWQRQGISVGASAAESVATLLGLCGPQVQAGP